VKIGHHDIDKSVFIIAEIGNNHEGDFLLAQDMIYAAAEAGVHAVKFQTIIPERLVAKSQLERIAQLRQFAFSPDQFAELAGTANKVGVEFLSTPFTPEVIPWLNELVIAFKVASGDNNYLALLREIASTGKPVLLSTGMSTLDDVKWAIEIIKTTWQNKGKHADLLLLHCVSAYPTPVEQANLAAIQTLSHATGYPVGYSDHTLGIEACVVAVCLGARVIEKHFTLCKSQSNFRDHALSADPSEMATLVKRVQEVQQLLGDGVKRIQEVEIPTISVARRSIVARTALAAGHFLSPEDLDCLRPGGGLPPSYEKFLVGHRLLKAVDEGEQLTLEKVD